MQMFINYVDGALTLDAHRDPAAACATLADIAEALSLDKPGRLVCAADSSDVDVLCDGAYWADTARFVTAAALEDLHDLLTAAPDDRSAWADPDANPYN